MAKLNEILDTLKLHIEAGNYKYAILGLDEINKASNKWDKSDIYFCVDPYTLKSDMQVEENLTYSQVFPNITIRVYQIQSNKGVTKATTLQTLCSEIIDKSNTVMYNIANEKIFSQPLPTWSIQTSYFDFQTAILAGCIVDLRIETSCIKS